MTDSSVILITGGLGRLGLALVDCVEQHGGTAIATTRDGARAQAFNASAERAGLRQRAVVCTLADPAAVGALVDQLLLDFGRVTGLVNNAYPALPYQEPGALAGPHWELAALVGLAIPEALSAELVQRRADSGIEAIVNIASIYGLVAPDLSIYVGERTPSPSYYGAIKAALLQLTRYHAAYWARHCVRINAVTPGGIFDHQEAAFIERYNAGVPLGRMGTRAEVARVVYFLLSNESAGITGQNFVVDGGRTII